MGSKVFVDRVEGVSGYGFERIPIQAGRFQQLHNGGEGFAGVAAHIQITVRVALIILDQLLLLLDFLLQLCDAFPEAAGDVISELFAQQPFKEHVLVLENDLHAAIIEIYRFSHRTHPQTQQHQRNRLRGGRLPAQV